MNPTNSRVKKIYVFFPSACVLISVEESYCSYLVYFAFWGSILRIFILVEGYPKERHILDLTFIVLQYLKSFLKQDIIQYSCSGLCIFKNFMQICSELKKVLIYWLTYNSHFTLVLHLFSSIDRKSRQLWTRSSHVWTQNVDSAGEPWKYCESAGGVYTVR